MTITIHGFQQERPQLQIGAISHSQPCRSRKPGWKFPLKRWTWTRWRYSNPSSSSASARSAGGCRRNGDAIYETTYGPMQGIPFARSTARDKTVYVHVFDWPGASMDLPGLDAKVESAALLSGGKPLDFHQSQGKIHVNLPPQVSDPIFSVIVLRTL